MPDVHDIASRTMTYSQAGKFKADPDLTPPQAMVLTMPPSTFSAAPLVADASFEAA
jgi:hypothetical protein